MTLQGAIAALAGALTYGQAVTALRDLYDRLHGRYPDAARQVIAEHNRLGSIYVDRPGDMTDVLFGGGGGQVSRDTPLSGEDSARLSRLAAALRRAEVPGADAIDPAKVPDAIDLAGRAARAAVPVGLIGLLLLLLLWFGSRRRA